MNGWFVTMSTLPVQVTLMKHDDLTLSRPLPDSLHFQINYKCKSFFRSPPVIHVFQESTHFHFKFSLKSHITTTVITILCLLALTQSESAQLAFNRSTVNRQRGRGYNRPATPAPIRGEEKLDFSQTCSVYVCF